MVEDDFIQEAYVPDNNNSIEVEYNNSFDEKKEVHHKPIKKEETPKKKEETLKKTTASKKEAKKTVKKEHPKKMKTNNHKKSKSTKTNITLAVIALIAIIVIIVFILNMGKLFDSNSSSPIAMVNGEIITQEDIDSTLKTVPSIYRPLLSEDELLNQTIMNTLLMQESKKQGITVTEEEIIAIIDDSIQTAGLTQEEFEDYLKEQNLTMKELENFYELHLSIEKLLEKTAYVGIDITDKEVEEFYNNNSANLENVSLEEVEDQIKTYLVQKEQSEALNEYINELMKNSDIIRLDQEKTSDENFTSEDVEKYSSCAVNNNIEKNTVIFVYSDSCPHCQRMKPIVTDLEKDYKFYWASASDSNAKSILGKCFSDVLAGGVPQFICAKNGETLVGEKPKAVLENFAVACNS